MPMYEFRCGECGTRFEALVDAGTAAQRCRRCGAAEAERVLSRPSEAPRLVGTARQNRRREDRNRVLRESAKAGFKERRKRGREAARQRGPRGGT